MEIFPIFPILWQYSQYFSNILEIFPIFWKYSQYSGNITNILEIFPIFWQYSQCSGNILAIFTIFWHYSGIILAMFPYVAYPICCISHSSIFFINRSPKYV